MNNNFSKIQMSGREGGVVLKLRFDCPIKLHCSPAAVLDLFTVFESKMPLQSQWDVKLKTRKAVAVGSFEEFAILLFDIRNSI